MVWEGSTEGDNTSENTERTTTRSNAQSEVDGERESDTGRTSRDNAQRARDTRGLEESGDLPNLDVAHSKGVRHEKASAVEFANGESAKPVYNEDNRLTGVNWSDGSKWSKDKDGQWNIYDSEGNLKGHYDRVSVHDDKVKAYGDNHTSVERRSDGVTVRESQDVTRIQYPNGNETSIRQANGQDAIIRDSQGNTWVKTLDNEFMEFDRDGNTTGRHGEADIDDQQIEIKADDGSVTQYRTDGSRIDYDKNGSVTQFASEKGETFKYKYEDGLLTEVTTASDGKTWTRGDDGDFHAGSEERNFIPPTTNSELTNGSMNAGDAYNPNDIDQQDVGNCYFLASLASVANQNPEVIRDMIQDNHDGTYTVTFPGHFIENGKDHGQPEPITVQAPTEQELERFAGNPNGTWVAVIEKAHRYLPERSDAPNEDNGGIESEALQLLTGQDASYMELSGGQYPLTSSLSPDTTPWVGDALTSALDSGAPVDVGIIGGANAVLPDGHAYTLIGYDPQSETVRIRNPWGSSTYGDVSESDVQAVIPSYQDLGNGQFVMSMSDFQNNFSDVTIGNAAA